MHLLIHLEQSNTDGLQAETATWEISSFFFFIISPIMLYLLHPYAKERNLAIHMVWTMMIFVGLFSAYFHMTLSFVGQMLDELSILWVLAMVYVVWFPRRLFPSFIKDRSTFSNLVLVITIVSTLSSFVKPTANAYVLNCFGIHMVYMLAVEMKWYVNSASVTGLGAALICYDNQYYLSLSCTDQKALRLCKVSVALWVLAVSCWISDRFGCSFWQSLNFCYLHGIWHILIVIAVAYGTTLIAYLDASYEIPYSLPVLQYWPCDRWAVGIPHIVLKGTTKTQKRC
ncbi:hypothetical protein F7725_027891 [Dissostichus mawsoni]|uniref:Alkaline ceramidase n=1 Tax=Dissostichus mawsoni TaxID=36200 RepID=A0A7J5XEQ9_DISMA|nr:hypothetical protein F7725_027891 [Dissostichus mawsoni]